MASGVSFIYASSEKNRMLACRFGEHRDNSRNSQSVFLVVYDKIKDEIILKKINRDCCGCNSLFFYFTGNCFPVK